MRLRGGGASHGAVPKYMSNRALDQDEYAAPYGTIMRTRSGAMIAPTPTPEWFEEGLMYQIYPLGTPGPGGGGFFGGVPATNDLTSPPEQKLLLLRQWYSHLVKLGVTSIYFSPLFESETHGYDTVDYFMIDRRVGDLETFKTIVEELHELGIKVILDGVFNHTGRNFFAFQEIIKAGANWAQCPYKEWYFISEGNSTYDDPFAYRSWEGHEELPELNVENEAVREYLFKVAGFWLGEVGVDGWRLDVAHELPPAFWRDFRTACTQANPEHVLLGEVIHGDYNVWVGPGKGLLHSGTNYQLSKALWSSLKEHNFWELDSAIQRDLMLYREMCLVNFLSNHDVARVATQLQGEPQLNKLAHFMLLTFRGVPCIYYGDELCVQGRKEDGDSALRMAMVPADETSGQWPHGVPTYTCTYVCTYSIQYTHAQVAHTYSIYICTCVCTYTCTHTVHMYAHVVYNYERERERERGKERDYCLSCERARGISLSLTRALSLPPLLWLSHVCFLSPPPL
jgi:cyclomaltodextrinase